MWLITAFIVSALFQSGCGRDDHYLHYRKSAKASGSGGVRKAELTETYIDDVESSGNLTMLRGQTALLTCVVKNIGNQSVSWLRHSYPIPQVLGLNNFTNVKDPRYSVLHTFGSEEYVMRIRQTRLSDAGFYECQVAGAITIYKIIKLDVVEPVTEILGGPDIYVDRGSTLNVTCVVWAQSKAPDYIMWSHNDKIILFEGSETSNRESLMKDTQGRFLSRLIIRRIGHTHAGMYTCQPASAQPATVSVHVLNGTVLAVADAEEIPGSSRQLVSTTSPTVEAAASGAIGVGMASAPSSAPTSTRSRMIIRTITATVVSLLTVWNVS